MVWLPDHIWAAQQAQKKGKGKSKGNAGQPQKGKGRGVGFGGFSTPEDEWMAMQMVEMVLAGGGGGKAAWGKGKGQSKGKIAAPIGVLQKAPKKVISPIGVGQKGAKKGVGQKGAKKGMAMIGVGQKTASVSVDMPWKSRLCTVYGRVYKTPPTKETFVYTTRKEDEGFVCVLSCLEFAQEYESQQETKKLAEEDAAKVAFMSEFPEEYAQVSMAAKVTGVKRNSAGAAIGKAQSGVNSDAKSRLNSAVQAICERPVVKGDVEYSVEIIDGSSVATVTIKEIGAQHQGMPVPGTDKDATKAAESSAAEEALSVHEELISAKKEELEARKAAKEDARRELMAAKHAEVNGDQIERPAKIARTVPATGVVKPSVFGKSNVVRPQSKSSPVATPAVAAGGVDAKSRLNTTMMVIAGRPLSKGDISYIVEEMNDKSVAKVTITAAAFDDGKAKTHKGRPVPGTGKDAKKVAECNAAEVALQALQRLYQVKKEECEARKAEKKALKG